MAGAHPDQLVLRESLAMGLSDTLQLMRDGEDPGERVSLLDELRSLASTHPDADSIRARLASGIANELSLAQKN
jgi:hypothetical protein